MIEHGTTGRYNKNDFENCAVFPIALFSDIGAVNLFFSKRGNSMLKKWNSLSLVVRIGIGLIIGAILGLTLPGLTWIGVLGKLLYWSRPLWPMPGAEI